MQSVGRYTAALALSPGDLNAILNRGMIREELGELQGALEDYPAGLTRVGRRHPLARRLTSDILRVRRALQGAE